MLRYIKHHVDTISGVEIYPIISLLLFFMVFITMLIYVYKIPKKSIEEISNLPLDNDLKDNSYEQ
ncbi:MAG: CcoQ/FixQ family Cbb3-type cytochrome c oxidase assembly chaperone [Flavobacteriaceae bacterium]|nr:CcoQ/FixQ family Cbb3-type cytochrome c oxidase assembly chaperone [Flavobacteriaceae bacterium]